MDKNCIGFKKKKVVSDPVWIACPDYETMNDNFSWLGKLFANKDEMHSCIHARHCENYEFNGVTESCAAGYWSRYDSDIED